MPNISMSISQSATMLLASKSCNHNQEKSAELVFNTLGTTHWVDSDKHINIGTALAGSGPAFCYRFFELMIQSSTELGLPESLAEALMHDMIQGATKLMIENKLPLSSLINQVQSKGGTTEAGLISFEKNGIEAIVKQAMIEAYNRAVELSTNN